MMTTKFKYGDVVQKHLNGIVYPTKYQVVSMTWYQSQHYRPDAYTVRCCCEPLDMVGLEHDEEEWIAEVNLILTRA